MKFPVLQIFDDGSLKIIKSENELDKDVDLSLCNSTQGDVFISENLDIGRRLYSNEDRTYQLLDSKHAYSELNHDDVCWREIVEIITQALASDSLSVAERKMANRIVMTIKSQ